MAFHTLGCKVNAYETQALREAFRKRGYEEAASGEAACVHVVNTCTVTAQADKKSRQLLRRIRREDPDAIIVAAGCFPQMKPEEAALSGRPDIIVGNGRKIDMICEVEKLLSERDLPAGEGNKKTISLWGKDAVTLPFEEWGIVRSMGSRTRAYVKIQEGCDRFCSYCVIPYARGGPRSREEDLILKEARALVDAGYREIVLTGINTALYKDLPGLLSKLDLMEGDFRIRLSSLEPTVVDGDFVKGLLEYDRLCHHLHLSVQSGSNRILKAMNRSYSREDYLRIVDILKDFDPHYGISTDVIAAFPTETERDFQESIRIIEQVGFCRVHGFGYSKRSGTPAADMEGQISEEKKKERVERLIEAGQISAERFSKGLVGTTCTVLPEIDDGDEERERSGMNKRVDSFEGYTDNYVRAKAEGRPPADGGFARVRITEGSSFGVKGVSEEK